MEILNKIYKAIEAGRKMFVHKGPGDWLLAETQANRLEWTRPPDEKRPRQSLRVTNVVTRSPSDFIEALKFYDEVGSDEHPVFVDYYEGTGRVDAVRHVKGMETEAGQVTLSLDCHHLVKAALTDFGRLGQADLCCILSDNREHIADADQLLGLIRRIGASSEVRSVSADDRTVVLKENSIKDAQGARVSMPRSIKVIVPPFLGAEAVEFDLLLAPNVQSNEVTFTLKLNGLESELKEALVERASRFFREANIDIIWGRDHSVNYAD